MKRRILYVGIFLAGALLMGAGGGIALAEYSSFEYLGERVLGQEHMAVTELMAERNPELPFTVRGGGWDQGKVEFVVDDTVPDDRLIFQPFGRRYCSVNISILIHGHLGCPHGRQFFYQDFT